MTLHIPSSLRTQDPKGNFSNPVSKKLDASVCWHDNSFLKLNRTYIMRSNAVFRLENLNDTYYTHQVIVKHKEKMDTVPISPELAWFIIIMLELSSLLCFVMLLNTANHGRKLMASAMETKAIVVRHFGLIKYKYTDAFGNVRLKYLARGYRGKPVFNDTDNIEEMKVKDTFTIVYDPSNSKISWPMTKKEVPQIEKVTRVMAYTFLIGGSLIALFFYSVMAFKGYI